MGLNFLFEKFLSFFLFISYSQGEGTRETRVPGLLQFTAGNVWHGTE